MRSWEEVVKVLREPKDIVGLTEQSILDLTILVGVTRTCRYRARSPTGGRRQGRCRLSSVLVLRVTQSRARNVSLVGVTGEGVNLTPGGSEGFDIVLTLLHEHYACVIRFSLCSAG